MLAPVTRTDAAIVVVGLVCVAVLLLSSPITALVLSTCVYYFWHKNMSGGIAA